MGSRVWASRTHLRWLACSHAKIFAQHVGQERKHQSPFSPYEKNDDLLSCPCEQVQKILERLSQLEPELGDAVKKFCYARQSAQKFKS